MLPGPSFMVAGLTCDRRRRRAAPQSKGRLPEWKKECEPAAGGKIFGPGTVAADGG